MDRRVTHMPICPYCKQAFAAKNIERDLIQGVAEGGEMFGRITYACPNCHYFLAVGDATPDQMTIGG